MKARMQKTLSQVNGYPKEIGRKPNGMGGSADLHVDVC